MINKYLEKKVNLITTDNFQNAQSNIQLNYFLIEQENDTVTNPYFSKSYGIEITQKNNTDHFEQVLVKDISPSRKKTLRAIKKLAYNTVTPLELPFILDDMIGIYI